MKADILYNIYETTKKNDANDLTVGLAMFKAEHPEVEISHEEDKAIREFLGRHNEALAEAFAQGPEAFEAAVEACEAADEAKTCQDGVCEIPEA